MDDLANHLSQVRERISQACLRSGRRPEEILLVAVTKTIPEDRIIEALQQGLTHLGENYIQEAQRKIKAIEQGTWHFIGHLQTNKVKQAITLFSMIETLDSKKLAREVNHQALQAGKTMEVLIQVNEAGELTKSGVPPDQVPSLLEEMPSWEGLRLRGLMSIPPYDPDPEQSRPWYRSLHCWQEKWEKQFPDLDLSHLSMGMSHDFEVAIEEGATIIRVGTALFGARS